MDIFIKTIHEEVRHDDITDKAKGQQILKLKASASLLVGFSQKEPSKADPPQGDSGGEEGPPPRTSPSPAGSPRPERGLCAGPPKITHRALLGEGLLLAAVALGCPLEILPKVPPRTSLLALEAEPQAGPPSPLRDPPSVDDLITFSYSDSTPTPDIDPASVRTPLPLHLCDAPGHGQLRVSRDSSGNFQEELAVDEPRVNRLLGSRVWGLSTDRRRKPSQELLPPHSGQSLHGPPDFYGS